jgi:hypothetical protein
MRNMTFAANFVSNFFLKKSNTQPLNLPEIYVVKQWEGKVVCMFLEGGCLFLKIPSKLYQVKLK